MTRDELIIETLKQLTKDGGAPVCYWWDGEFEGVGVSPQLGLWAFKISSKIDIFYDL